MRARWLPGYTITDEGLTLSLQVNCGRPGVQRILTGLVGRRIGLSLIYVNVQVDLISPRRARFQVTIRRPVLSAWTYPPVPPGLVPSPPKNILDNFLENE